MRSEALEVFKAVQEGAEALLQFLEAALALGGLATPLHLAATRALGRRVLSLDLPAARHLAGHRRQPVSCRRCLGWCWLRGQDLLAVQVTCLQAGSRQRGGQHTGGMSALPVVCARTAGGTLVLCSRWWAATATPDLVAPPEPGGPRRYLADQPLAFHPRVQALLPDLLRMQAQAACPFLLPLLTQLADPWELAALQADAEEASTLGWPQALRQPQVSCLQQDPRPAVQPAPLRCQSRAKHWPLADGWSSSA